MITRVIPVIAAVLVSACVTTYTAVGPGTVEYDGLKLSTGQAWNEAPPQTMPSARTGTKLLTQDGVLLDRIIVIPGVSDGESILRPVDQESVLPEFRSDMLPNEIEELVEASLTRLYGEGSVVIETGNLRPHRYGDDDGFLFDVALTSSEGPNYRGVAGALVKAQKLFLILYLGADPFYYEKHLNEALIIIKGARV